MREGWKRYKIEELGRIITGKTPSTQNPENFGTKYPFITPKDMVGRKRIFQTERYLSEEGKNAVKNCLLPPNSVCVSCIGSDMGKVAMTTKSSVTNQQLNSIVCSHVFDSDFVYYAVTNISESLKNAGHHSTAVPILNKSDFSNFEIDAPDLPSQHRIASILSALDDKIELNRQTNQTLEAIAQAIFKEWFVDFRFPHSPLEGWQTKSDGVESSPLEGCPKGGVESLHAKPTSLPSWQKNSLFPFWTLPKNHKLKERAKELRKQGILSEVVFWKAFKDKKKLGWDIDRQVIIGNFIVDFFIPELGLVFEIDGSSHNDKQEYDQERDAFLSSLQLKVVRISDKDVLRNIEGVWSFVTESIKDRVEELEEKTPPRPSGTPQEGNKCEPAGTLKEGNKYKDDGGEMQDSELGPIPKGWRVGKLGEICERITKGTTPTTMGDKFVEKGITFLRAECIQDEVGIDESKALFINEETHDKLKRSKLVENDILITIAGTIGRIGIVPKRIIPANTNQAIGIIRIDPSIIPTTYTYYFIKQQSVKEELLSGITQSVQANISLTDLTNLKINIPETWVASSFDSIISKVRAQMETLTAQSATLTAIRDSLLPKLMNGDI